MYARKCIYYAMGAGSAGVVGLAHFYNTTRFGPALVGVWICGGLILILTGVLIFFCPFFPRLRARSATPSRANSQALEGSSMVNNEVIVKSFENRQPAYTDAYRIKFVREASYWTMWVVVRPCDPHGKGVTVHHMYKNGKLCQREGYESKDLPTAVAFAHWWMKRYSIYVHSDDGNFPMTSEAVEVPD